MNFGPDPRQQLSWDWRAAGNFICGGAGAGLLVFAVLSAAAGAQRAALLLGGLALIGLGLFFVWLEIGRPLRALHVFFNPHTSWMSREAFTAAVLFPTGLAAAAGVPGADWGTGVLALVFGYCQGRMLQASKGIPAWREPLLVPLIVATGLAEGGGWFAFAHAWSSAGTGALWLGFSVALIARALLWWIWRQRVAPRAAPLALAAIDAAGKVLLLAGTAVPLAAMAWVVFGQPGAAENTVLAVGGLFAVAAGAWFKFELLGRASFNQGFALAHLPVRGARR
jgi:phenylacetyl-CoA:acceptor oxidoreductase subunit 2